MDQQDNEAEQKLRKLGSRLRVGIQQRNVLDDQRMDQIRAAIREQWHLDRASSFTRTPGPDKGRNPSPPKPPEPDAGR